MPSDELITLLLQDCDGKLLKSMELLKSKTSINLKRIKKLFTCRLQPKQLTDFCLHFVNGTCKMSGIFDKNFKITAC